MAALYFISQSNHTACPNSKGLAINPAFGERLDLFIEITPRTTISSKIPTDTGTVRHAQVDRVLCSGQMINSQKLVNPESSQDGR